MKWPMRKREKWEFAKPIRPMRGRVGDIHTHLRRAEQEMFRGRNDAASGWLKLAVKRIQEIDRWVDDIVEAADDERVEYEVSRLREEERNAHHKMG